MGSLAAMILRATWPPKVPEIDLSSLVRSALLTHEVPCRQLKALSKLFTILVPGQNCWLVIGFFVVSGW